MEAVTEGRHSSKAATTAAVHGIIRSELDNLGRRLDAFRVAANAEMERLAALQWLTDAAHISRGEVAERVGVSRQTVINLRATARGLGYEWPIDLRILLELGLHGPQTAEALRGSLGEAPASEHQVSAALDRLGSAGMIEVAGHAASGVTKPVTYLRIAPAGLNDLPRRLRAAAIPPSRAWTAYVASSPAEANALAAAGEQALGEHGVVVIPAGTLIGMEHPEVAFRVEASDPQSAEVAAVALFRSLRERAGMAPKQGPIVVSALVPPDPVT